MLELAKCQFGLISKLRRSVCVWGGGGWIALIYAEKEVLLVFCVHAIQA